MSNGTLNPHALNITAKITHKIKYLDGACSLTILVKTWESGEPYYREIELFIGWDDKAKANVTEVTK